MYLATEAILNIDLFFFSFSVVVLYVQGLGTKEWREVSALFSDLMKMTCFDMLFPWFQCTLDGLLTLSNCKTNLSMMTQLTIIKLWGVKNIFSSILQ